MKAIFTDKAPAPIGPFSQAMQTQNLLFCSGQVGVAPGQKSLISDDVQAQTLQVLENIKQVLNGAGLKLTNIAKMTVYLTDMNDFGKMNETYLAFFGNHKPARTAVEVARLPLNANVEMECFASL